MITVNIRKQGGAAPEDVAALNEETAWAREGEPVGRELE